MARGSSREPQRTCVGCRKVRDRAALIRIARAADGSVFVDRTGRSPGRGAYVCPDGDCLERAHRRLAGALRTKRIDFEALVEAIGKR